MSFSNVPVTVQPVNYAQAIMIKSFPLALAFTSVYVPLLAAFLFKAVRNPTYVLWVTAFFCQGLLESFESVSSWRLMRFGCPVRIVSFAMRAVLTKSESAAENFDFVLAEQIVYGVGFFGILYAAYIMVLDRYGSPAHSYFPNADRFADKSSKGPSAAHLSPGSPRIESLSGFPWSLLLRSVLPVPFSRIPGRCRAPSTPASI
jgi:hypothetical protein